MNENIVILIVALVAVNLILITIAVVRSMRRKDTYGPGAAYNDDVMRRPVAADLYPIEKRAVFRHVGESWAP